MKHLLLVVVVYVCMPSMLNAQGCCPDDTTDVIAVYHIYNTIDPLKYMGSVAHKACYNEERHAIIRFINIDTSAIMHGCGPQDNFPARLQKRFHTKKLPQLWHEERTAIYILPYTAILMAREISIYNID